MSKIYKKGEFVSNTEPPHPQYRRFVVLKTFDTKDIEKLFRKSDKESLDLNLFCNHCVEHGYFQELPAEPKQLRSRHG